MRPVPLTRTTVGDLPACCTDCVFWQTLRGHSSESIRDRWIHRTERSFGPWGRMLSDDGTVVGVMQYGPASAFPRAQVLPAGPPGRDAALITCAYVDGGDTAGSVERLVLEALADIKGRGMQAIEAFAMRYPEEVPTAERAGLNHTLFDLHMLERLGFRAVRSRGQVSLMRLELGGVIAGGAESARVAIADARSVPGEAALPA